ncbi:MAG: hypothetical protein JWR41_13, partial [Modestobacter sp.]|nr:hypothetical protein [Modestobacter sp.]
TTDSTTSTTTDSHASTTSEGGHG